VGIFIQNYFGAGILKSTFPLPPPGIYVTFPFIDSDCAISLLASIFRSVRNASPAFSRAAEIVEAASASPCARITAACLSCSAFKSRQKYGQLSFSICSPFPQQTWLAQHLQPIVSKLTRVSIIFTLLCNLFCLYRLCEFLLDQMLQQSTIYC
jgi:hypothetical protein